MGGRPSALTPCGAFPLIIVKGSGAGLAQMVLCNLIEKSCGSDCLDTATKCPPARETSDKSSRCQRLVLCCLLPAWLDWPYGH